MVPGKINVGFCCLQMAFKEAFVDIKTFCLLLFQGESSSSYSFARSWFVYRCRREWKRKSSKLGALAIWPTLKVGRKKLVFCVFEVRPQFLRPTASFLIPNSKFLSRWCQIRKKKEDHQNLKTCDLEFWRFSNPLTLLKVVPMFESRDVAFFPSCDLNYSVKATY